MDNGKFQEVVLEQLGRITKDISELKTGQNEMRTDINGLQAGQESLRAGQEEMRADINELRTGQESLRAGQEALHARQVVMEKTMHDKFGIVFDFIDYQRQVNKEILDDLKGLHYKVDRLELGTAHVRQVR